MTRISFAAILALAMSAQASFHIPPGTPDGVYGVTVDSDGTAHHVNKRDGTTFTTPKKSNLEPSDFTEKFFLGKRWTDGPKCVPSGAVLVRNDIALAQYALGDACEASGDEFIPAGGNRYSKFGNAVVYVCNYGVKTQHCYRDELDSDFKEVEALCGDVAGYYSRYSSWKKTYGIEDVDNDFC